MFGLLSRMHARRSRRLGFSLIEVLVATSVLCLLMTVAFSLIAASSRTFHRSEREMNALSDARFALDAIGSDLTLSFRDGGVPLGLVSQGGNDILQCYSYVPSASPVGDTARNIAQVTYRINEAATAGSYRLQRSASGLSWTGSTALPFIDPTTAYQITTPGASEFDNASDSVFRIEFSMIDKNGNIKKSIPQVPQDFSNRVSAVIVTIASLDPEARKILSDPLAHLARLVEALPDSADGQVTAQKWMQTLNDTESLSASTGVPESVLASVHVSQRIYYVW